MYIAKNKYPFSGLPLQCRGSLRDDSVSSNDNTLDKPFISNRLVLVSMGYSIEFSLRTTQTIEVALANPFADCSV